MTARRHPTLRSLLAAAALTFVLPALPAGAAPADYPTDVLADYVFGCMATNGQTQDALVKCSCSIDRVADKLTFDEYLQAETALRMRQMQGGEDRAVIFRTMPSIQAMVDKLRQAQVEAELQCF